MHKLGMGSNPSEARETVINFIDRLHIGSIEI
jgi:hypothetical protein